MGTPFCTAHELFDFYGKAGHNRHPFDGLEGLACFEATIVGNRWHFNIDVFNDEPGSPDFHADDHVVNDTGRYNIATGSIGIDQAIVFQLSLYDNGGVFTGIDGHIDTSCVNFLKFLFVNCHHGLICRFFLWLEVS